MNDANRFPTRFADLDTGVRLAYIDEGDGYPLLLVHGYPQSKRLWWRNIQPLADAGYRVIAPDLRGYGESSLAPDAHYDPAAFGTDLHELLTIHLDLDHVGGIGGDLGGVILIDLSIEHPDLIDRLCLYNTDAPDLPANDHPPAPEWRKRTLWDYGLRQGHDPDQLIAELDTEAKRRRYLAEFYGHRMWCNPANFTAGDVDFHTTPLSADPDKLRAIWTDYQTVVGTATPSRPEHLHQPVTTPTLICHGPDDVMTPATWLDRCRSAFTNLIGPVTITGAGHHLPWERPHELNTLVAHLFADLAARGTAAAR